MYLLLFIRVHSMNEAASPRLSRRDLTVFYAQICVGPLDAWTEELRLIDLAALATAGGLLRPHGSHQIDAA